jgi:hypothetical protein
VLGRPFGGKSAASGPPCQELSRGTLGVVRLQVDHKITGLKEAHFSAGGTAALSQQQQEGDTAAASDSHRTNCPPR